MKYIFSSIFLFALFCGCKKNDCLFEQDVIKNIESIDLSLTKLIISAENDIYQKNIFQITAGDQIKPFNFSPTRNDFDYSQFDVHTPYKLTSKYLQFMIEDSVFIADLESGALTRNSLDVDDFSNISFTSANTVYYENEDYQIVRCDLSSPSHPKETVISYKDDHVYNYTTDNDGNVVYMGNFDGNNIIRAICADGNAKKNLPYNSTYMDPFSGADGNIYYTSDIDGQSETALIKVSFSPFTIDTLQKSNNYPSSRDGFALIKNTGHCMIYHWFKFYMFDKDANMTFLNDRYNWDIDNFVTMESNGNFCYIVCRKNSGETVLLKFDPTELAFTELINERYDITTIATMKDNSVYFKALDVWEFTSVIGKVNDDKTVTIIDNNFPAKVEFIKLD